MPAGQRRKTYIGIAFAAAALIAVIGHSAWSTLSHDGDPSVAAGGQNDLPDEESPPHAHPHREAVAMATASTFIEKRPGDVLNRYLGVVQSDALHRHISRMVAEERATCYSENGLTPPAEDSPDKPRSKIASLKGNDIAAFRSAYGFGVVEEYLESLEATREASAAPAELPNLTKEQTARAEDVASKCAVRTATIINDNLAPAQMHARTSAMMMKFGESKAYQEVSTSWRECMASAGYGTRYGPYESRAMAEDFLQRHLQNVVTRSLERRGLSQEEQEAHREATSEAFQEIPDSVLTELRNLEMRIYTADARCLSSSGAGHWMANAENQIMRTLRQEFPSFSGVDAGPKTDRDIRRTP